MDKYSINQQSINTLLTWVESGQVAIPEIQRPFVWSKTQVRNLMDSLYQGYPVGYIITWQNPDVKLKDGTTSVGKKILIDGQQRITALRAAVGGLPILNKQYKTENVAIAFNPQTEEFNTRTPAIERSREWISDISKVMSTGFDTYSFIEEYAERNSSVNKSEISRRINSLINIRNKQIGEIQLSQQLDIEVVNEIFVRINASGVNLSNADFAMSKIAVYEKELGDEFGMKLRKFIDYFCNLAVAPEQYRHIENNDTEFAKTPYFNKIAWLKNDADNLYDPTYNDILRVVSLTHFGRGKLSDLVALLAGRDFETRENLKEVADQSFQKLEAGVYEFTNQNNFQHFVQDILRGAAFDDVSMLNARNAVNYAYAVYLRLRAIGEDPAEIDTLVRRLFVISLLTARHSGSFETRFQDDIKRLNHPGDLRKLVETLEEQDLPEVFWRLTLPDEFDKTNTTNAFWQVFIAAQKKLRKQSFLTDIEVYKMTTGDIHHIFPKNYLVKNGFDKSEYNKIANFVFLRNDVNIKISDKEPRDYISQIENGGAFGSSIKTLATMQQNFADNAIPETLRGATFKDYHDFLRQRRELMAELVHEYYYSL